MFPLRSLDPSTPAVVVLVALLALTGLATVTTSAQSQAEADLGSPACGPAWHLVLTGLTWGQAPTTVEVHWEEGEPTTVERAAFDDGTAHYAVEDERNMTSALVAPPEDWSGSFELAHEPCPDETADSDCWWSGDGCPSTREATVDGPDALSCNPDAWVVGLNQMPEPEAAPDQVSLTFGDGDTGTAARSGTDDVEGAVLYQLSQAELLDSPVTRVTATVHEDWDGIIQVEEGPCFQTRTARALEAYRNAPAPDELSALPDGTLDVQVENTEADCGPRWLLAVTDLSHYALVPGEIEVQFESGLHTLPLASFVGGTAHYVSTSALQEDQALQSASATVPSDWSGSFELVERNCSGHPGDPVSTCPWVEGGCLEPHRVRGHIGDYACNNDRWTFQVSRLPGPSAAPEAIQLEWSDEVVNGEEDNRFLNLQRVSDGVATYQTSDREVLASPLHDLVAELHPTWDGSFWVTEGPCHEEQRRSPAAEATGTPVDPAETGSGDTGTGDDQQQATDGPATIQAQLEDASCGPAWHLTLTGFTWADRPSHIQATFTDGEATERGNWSIRAFDEDTVHYVEDVDGISLQEVTVDVPEGWEGTFKLVHRDCGSTEDVETEGSGLCWWDAEGCPKAYIYRADPTNPDCSNDASWTFMVDGLPKGAYTPPRIKIVWENLTRELPAAWQGDHSAVYTFVDPGMARAQLDRAELVLHNAWNGTFELLRKPCLDGSDVAGGGAGDDTGEGDGEGEAADNESGEGDDSRDVRSNDTKEPVPDEDLYKEDHGTNFEGDEAADQENGTTDGSGDMPLPEEEDEPPATNEQEQPLEANSQPAGGTAALTPGMLVIAGVTLVGILAAAFVATRT